MSEKQYTSESRDFHPLVAEWLTKHGYAYIHEYKLPLGRVDFYATHTSTNQILLVEAKLWGDVGDGIRQAINYRHQIDGADAAIFAPQSTISASHRALASRYNVQVVEFDIGEKPLPQQQSVSPTMTIPFKDLPEFLILSHRLRVYEECSKMALNGLSESKDAIDELFKAIAFRDGIIEMQQDQIRHLFAIIERGGVEEYCTIAIHLRRTNRGEWMDNASVIEEVAIQLSHQFGYSIEENEDGSLAFCESILRLL